jgi:biotin carboxyl carrier protein
VANARRFLVRTGGASTVVEVLADGRVRVGGQDNPLTVSKTTAGEYLVTDSTRSWRVAVAGPPDARFVGAGGATACVEVQPEGEARPSRTRAADAGTSAPMPGTVIGIAVDVGQHVRAGDVLLTLEAMKMELPIRAHRGGVVSAIRCAPGDLVRPGPPLVEIA